MRRVFIVSILSICAVGLAVAWPDNLSGRTASTSGTESPGVNFSPAGVEVAQTAVGYNCRTAAGVCPIEPAPLGAPCRCGEYQGFVIP
jgi:hypothetical protein